MVFSSVVSNVVLMLFYMSLGYVLTKGKKTFTDHAKSLSGVLVYVCTPAMILNAFLSMDYTPVFLSKALQFLCVSLILMVLFVGILFLLFHKRFNDSRYRILTVSAILGNVGYFGLPVVTGLFPETPIAACYCTINLVGMNLLVFTLGSYLITNNTKYISLKSAFINPAVLSAAVSVVLYLFRVSLPEAILAPISVLAKMSTPLCMIILGIRLASMNFRSIFLQPVAYAASGLKLIVFPVFAFLAIWFLPFWDETFKITMFVLCSAPSAAIILSLSEMYGCEQRLCANTVLITTLFSLITIPLLLLPIALLN